MQDDQKKVSAVVFAVLLDLAFLALAIEIFGEARPRVFAAYDLDLSRSTA